MFEELFWEDASLVPDCWWVKKKFVAFLKERSCHWTGLDLVVFKQRGFRPGLKPYPLWGITPIHSYPPPPHPNGETYVFFCPSLPTFNLLSLVPATDRWAGRGYKPVINDLLGTTYRVWRLESMNDLWGPGFLVVVWFRFSSPHSPSPFSKLSLFLSLPVYMWPV